MRVVQSVTRSGAWPLASHSDAQLVLAFCAPALLENERTWEGLRRSFPAARIVACSTAGEIFGTCVYDDSVVCTGITLEHSHFAIAAARVDEATDSSALGELVMSRLPLQDLVHVFVLSGGLHVNGSALVRGIANRLPQSVAMTGGLAADGAAFRATSVCLDGPVPSEQVVAIGWYGAALRIGYGCMGGWAPFGPERLITRANGNVLHELDGEPALDLYKRYLGAHAAELPASALLFPLSVRPGDKPDEMPLVRTILSVDERERTLTFTGDLPLGHRARLMRANFEHLVEGASTAAKSSHERTGGQGVDLALIVSCLGRKLMMKQRVEEEVEAVRDVLGPATVLTGFYSYGELSPSLPTLRCELHNQTMTITTISEL